MSSFFELASIFTGHPERAYLVALVFIALGLIDRRLARTDPETRPWAMFVPAAAWLLYAINEYGARHDDIAVRIDVYLIWPVIVLLSALFLGVWIQNLRRMRRTGRAAPGTGAAPETPATPSTGSDAPHSVSSREPSAPPSKDPHERT